jgi:hypothetical protein
MMGGKTFIPPPRVPRFDIRRGLGAEKNSPGNRPRHPHGSGHGSRGRHGFELTGLVFGCELFCVFTAANEGVDGRGVLSVWMGRPAGGMLQTPRPPGPPLHHDYQAVV